MDLPQISGLNVSEKRVIVRSDLDVDSPNPKDQRLNAVAETIKFLLSKNSKVIVMGHRGRPDGKVDNQFTLKPVCDVLSEIVGQEIKFVYDIAGAEAKEGSSKLQNGEVVMLENLRFDSHEESNDANFAKSLSDLGELYVNESFADSHREHASIVGIPKLLPHAAGLRFQKEVENLSKIFENPKRPLVFLISGLKEDKLKYVKAFEVLADKILIGGRLPDFLGDAALESVRSASEKDKVVVGNLNMDKEDITLNTIDVFEKEIKRAQTIVVSGPLGKYEEEGHRMGTEKIISAVANTYAFKVAGGGDTEQAIAALGLTGSFNWISVGGGAMLEFLSNKTLPGIKALLE